MKRLLFILILLSCKEKNNLGLNFRQVQLEEAQSQILDLNFSSADSILTSMNSISRSDGALYKQYCLTRIENQRKTENFDLHFLNQCLERCGSNRDNYYYQLLLEKSSYLTEKGLANFAIATSAHSAQELTKLNAPDSVLAKAYFIHGINLLRESICPEDSIYIEKAWNLCADVKSPLCRKIKVLQLYKKNVNSLTEIDSLTLSYLTVPSQYSPETDKFINTTLGWMMDDQNSKDAFLNNPPYKELENICSNSFWSKLYQIENEINSKEFEKADSSILDWEDTCDFLDLKLIYVVFRLKYKFALERYHYFCDEKYLDSALVYIDKCINSSTKGFSLENTLHFADFLHETNSDHLNTLFLLQNEGRNIESYLFKTLSHSKTHFKNPINQNLNFKNSLDPEKYRTLIEKINRIELDLKNNKALYTYNADQYSQLFDLHTEKNILDESFTEKRNKDTSKLTLGEYQSILKREKVQFLDLSILDSIIYLTVIDPDTIYLEKINYPMISIEIKASFEKIRSKMPINNDFLKLVHSNLSKVHPNIIISTDQDFSSFPFDVFQIESGKSLIDFYNISYVSGLSNTFNYTSNVLENDICFGSYSSSNTLKSNLKDQIHELPLGLKEVNLIEKGFSNSKKMLGSTFTKTSVLNNFNYRILHYTTHSNSNPSNILENYMYVRDANGNPEKLYGFEIKNKKIPHSLVILSSCNSGTGAYKPGAGTFSLSRDFLSAGAQTVIKSLWPVNEVSTFKLMETFYDNLLKGIPVGESLTLAKRALKSDPRMAHPYYWAAFVLEGNPYLILEN